MVFLNSIFSEKFNSTYRYANVILYNKINDFNNINIKIYLELIPIGRYYK